MPIGVDILGPVSSGKRGLRFLLVFSDHFTKINHAVNVRKIDAYTVALDFAEEWIFTYWATETVIKSKGSPLASEVFRRVYQGMCIEHL